MATIKGTDNADIIDLSSEENKLTIQLKGGNDVLISGSGNDEINAGKGDDRITGGEGNDAIDGGQGLDTSVYTNSVFDYLNPDRELTLSNYRNGFLIFDTLGDEGVDTLLNVEALEFNDATYYMDGRNNGPVARNSEAITDEETAITIDISKEIVDLDGDTIKVGLVDPATSSGSVVGVDGYIFSYDPTGQFDYLGVGESAVDTITYQISDGKGGTTTAEIAVTITGTNDAPVIGAVLAKSVAEGDTLFKGQLASTDLDTGPATTATFSTTSTQAGFALSADGSYSFDPTDSEYDYLNAGDALIITIPVTVTDDQNATDTTNIVINMTGTNDAPVIDSVAAVSVAEGDILFYGQLASTDLDAATTATFSTTSTQAGFALSADGSHSFDPTNGAYHYLNAGDELTITIPVTVTDDQNATDTTNIVINMTGTNDAPFIYSVAVVSIAEGDALFTGQLASTDLDAGATATFSTTSTQAGFVLSAEGSYSFDPTDSEYDYLNAGDALTITIPVTVTDDQNATDTTNIVINMMGTNDAPVIDSAAPVSVYEGEMSFYGQLTSTDLDRGAATTATFSTTSTQAGFALSADGSHSFDPTNGAYDYLNAGDALIITIPVTVTDDQNATSTTNIVINMTGTNDAPFIYSVAAISSAEGDLLFYGQLTSADLDTGATATFSAASTQAGFELNADGSYSFDPTNAAYNYLNAGDILTITIPVVVMDDQNATDTTNIIINLTGTNDAPVIDSVAVSIAEGDALFNGQLTSTDLDTGATATFSTTSIQSGFVLSADGSYSFDPTNAAYNYLSADDALTITIPVTVTDDQNATDTTNIVINLSGTNDQPVVDDVNVEANNYYKETDVKTNTEYTQEDSSVTGLSDGNYIIPWTSFNLITEGDGIETVYSDTLVLASDLDDNDTHTFQQVGTAEVVVNNGEVITDLAVNIDAATGEYDITGNFDALSAGETATVTFEYTADDQRGFDGADGINQSSVSEAKMVTLVVTGTNDQPVVNDVNVNVGAYNYKETHVNTYTENTQQDSSITGLSEGGYVVTWTSLNQTGDESYSIRSQIFDTDGNKVGGETHVNTHTVNAQLDSSVTGLSEGGYVVTWTSQDQGGDEGNGIRSQIFNSAGNKVGTETHVNTYIAGAQEASSVTGLLEGGYVVTWHSLNQIGDGSYGIRSQIFDSAGNTVGSETHVNTYITDRQLDSSVTGLSEGGYVVTWTSNNQDGDVGYGIRAQMFDKDGVKVGTATHVNTYTTSYQFESSVTDLVGGGYVVTWTSSNQIGDEGTSIRSQVFDSAGNAVGSETHVNTYTTSYQQDSSVTGLSEGRYVVTWTSTSQGGDESNGIRSQIFDSTGNKVGSEAQVNTVTANTQERSSVTSLSEGGYMVTWTSSNQNGDASFGIYSQRFDANGNKIDPNADLILEGDGIEIVYSDTLVVSDLDVNNTHTFQQVGTAEVVVNKGEVITDLAVNISATGEYNVVGNFDALSAGETATVTFQYTADDQRGFDGTDGVNQSSVSEAKTVTLVVTGTNDAPVIDDLILADGVNESLTYIGQVTATDVDANEITFSVTDTDFVIDATTGDLSYAVDANGHPIMSDYETNTSATVAVTATDYLGNASTKDISFAVNDIVGTLAFVDLISPHTFDGNDTDGWAGTGTEYDKFGDGVLGGFRYNSDVQWQHFNFSDYAGETVTIAFELLTHAAGGTNATNGWEGDDTFHVSVMGVGLTIINSYSPDAPKGEENTSDQISFDIKVPDNGTFDVIMSSQYTSENYIDDYNHNEYWAIDDFTIKAELPVLSFENSHEGTIDLSAVIAQDNDFGSSTLEKVSKIDLTDAQINILTNITLNDVISLTTNTNELIITGDATDTVALDGTVWKETTTAGTYTNIDAGIEAGPEIVMIAIDNVIVEIF